MYGANLDFSSVTLPGVGGSMNAATAISTDKLEEMNRTGKKWRTDKDGNMSFHNEALLEANKASRQKKENLVNRDRDAHADGKAAMKEIFGRKRARMEAFREIKRKEYNFADDTELMSMPQPFSQATCKGVGKCKCDSCKAAAKSDADFREWSASKRQKLQSGEERGEFAGPGMSFPVASAQDVSAAWSSVGRAANPRKIMSEIIRIAKKYGWESGLPQTVKDRMGQGESGLPSPDFSEEAPSARGSSRKAARAAVEAGQSRLPE